VRVYLNTTKNKDDPRKLTEVELVKEFKSTLLVRLSDGNVILRKKSRDLPKEGEK